MAQFSLYSASKWLNVVSHSKFPILALNKQSDAMQVLATQIARHLTHLNAKTKSRIISKSHLGPFVLLAIYRFLVLGKGGFNYCSPPHPNWCIKRYTIHWNIFHWWRRNALGIMFMRSQYRVRDRLLLLEVAKVVSTDEILIETVLRNPFSFEQTKTFPI